MRHIGRFLLPISVIACIFAFFSCNKDRFHTTVDYTKCIEGLNVENLPVMDCSTSTHPLATLVVYELMGIPHKWVVSFLNGVEKHIVWDTDKYYDPEINNALQCKLKCSTTHGSYMNLIEGKAALIIASRSISRDEELYRKECGVELIETPIGLDGFVFIKNAENRVQTITSEQIQDIYTGKITHWKILGGEDVPITPYIRNRNSGSQEKMETLVMQGKTMLDSPELLGGGMTSPFFSLWENKYGIAYTPYYYCTTMVNDPRIAMFHINGIAPTKQSIASGRYPYVSKIYAVVRADTDKNTMTWKLFEFITSGKADAIILESGYIPIPR